MSIEENLQNKEQKRLDLISEDPMESEGSVSAGLNEDFSDDAEELLEQPKEQDSVEESAEEEPAKEEPVEEPAEEEPVEELAEEEPVEELAEEEPVEELAEEETVEEPAEEEPVEEPTEEEPVEEPTEEEPVEEPAEEEPVEEPAEEEPVEEPAEEEPVEEPAEEEPVEEPAEEEPVEEPEKVEDTEEISDDKITDLVEELQEAFSDNSENASDEVSVYDLAQLADELDDGITDEQDYFDEEDDTKTFIGTSVKKSVIGSGESFLSDDALDEIDSRCADVDILLPQQSVEIEQTHVFEPVRPQPSYGETVGSSDRYSHYENHAKSTKKKYGFFKGLTQIAGLLIVVAGLAWLLSIVAFSAMGEGNTSSAEEYDYSTSSTIIKPFYDDDDTESVVVPEFTTDKLTIGDKGEMVMAVQRTLASLGYLASGKVSGMYDVATNKAVKQFQKANFLDVTGEVDKVTYSLIFDSNATAPTTKTTELPTTTEADTSATGTETSPTGEENTEPAFSNESDATSAVSSQDNSTTESKSENTTDATTAATKETTASDKEKQPTDVTHPSETAASSETASDQNAE